MGEPLTSAASVHTEQLPKSTKYVLSGQQRVRGKRKRWQLEGSSTVLRAVGRRDNPIITEHLNIRN